ncbi:MAG TPA: hypothetical protein V6D03_05065, partial [Candidatus Caenarcaniphilales bacterium]
CGENDPEKNFGIERQSAHQANAPTFLAGRRTSIALISFGLAMARFGLLLRQLQIAITQQEAPLNPSLDSENFREVFCSTPAAQSLSASLIAGLPFTRCFLK